VSLLRRRRGDDFYGGQIGPLYPEAEVREPGPAHPVLRRRTPVPTEPPVPKPVRPSLVRRTGRRLDDWRRRILPLPDEVIDQYLGHGERMIHNDHPSLGAFVVQNVLMFLGLFIVAVVFLGITFNGSLVTAGVTFLVLGVVLLYLVLKRLRERYTSYVVTNVRIMRISGVFARRAHSIPWVRVTDLTYQQSLIGRLFGFADLRIESANEEGGLRNLVGVSDPVRFNQYIVDMVVAKQGPTAPGWEQTGQPAPIVTLPRSGVFERMRAGRERRRAGRYSRRTAPPEQTDPDVGPPVAYRRDPTAPVRVDLPLSEQVTPAPTPAPALDDDELAESDAGPYDNDDENSELGDDLNWRP
jgi:membrane protein YdbS with pleckstrin-like domain